MADWISGIAGLLGFVLSVYTLIITRIERRKSLSIHIICHEREDWAVEGLGEESAEFITFKIVNTSERRIHLDVESVDFYCNSKKLDKIDLDIICGKERIPDPLNPGESTELCVLSSRFLMCGGFPDYGAFSVNVDFSIKDIEGKEYRNKSKYVLLAEVGVIEKQ